MEITEAVKVLGLKPPTTTNAIKQAYKRASLLEHPDHSKHPQASERFQRVRKAYEIAIVNHDIIELTSHDMEELRCQDGTPLSELGNGLGPRVNGRPCEFCEAKGFTSYRAGFIHCDNCHPVGFVGWEYKCSRCEGSGDFRDKKGRIKGKCFKCNGLGWKRGRGHKNRCFKCNGLQMINDPNAPTLYRKCLECKGCGEVRIFNPVLPKGLLNL